MAEQVTRWQAKDGSVHLTREEAEKQGAKSRLVEAYHEDQRSIGDFSYSMLEFIEDNRDDVLKYLGER